MYIKPPFLLFLRSTANIFGSFCRACTGGWKSLSGSKSRFIWRKQCNSITPTTLVWRFKNKPINISRSTSHVSTHFPRHTDTEGLKAQSIAGSSMGFTGKQVIHPAQVDVVQESFSPSQQRFEWAQELLKAFSESDNKVRLPPRVLNAAEF